MSIIYEALKKTQQKREAQTQLGPQAQKAEPRMVMRLMRLKLWIIPSILILAMFMGYNGLMMAHKAKLRKTAAAGLVLNGVFITEDTKFAMINNHAYKTGEKVAEMDIVSIDLNSVKLKNADDDIQTLTISI